MVSILVLQAEGLVCTIHYSGFLFQTTSMLTTNEIVKESIFHTTSKKVLRSSEKQKPRAYRTHSMSGLKVFSGLRLVANERSIIDELRMLPKSSYYINIIFIIFVIYIQCPIIKRVITIKKIIRVIIFIYTHQVQISVFF